MTKAFLLAALLGAAIPAPPGTAWAQAPLTIRSLAERKVADLPEGTIYWRVENFATLAEAQAAAGPWSLAAMSAGKTWLFTLGPAGASTAGGRKVAEVGPIPHRPSPGYLLRINEATGPAGSVTPVHSHPGSEAFYVISGEQSIRGPAGTLRVSVGHPEAGLGTDVPMQVSSVGPDDLHALVMFVLDASRPFSSPAKLP